MKLGIVTFHSAINYGAVLQAYALQEKCKEYINNTYIINYNPNYIRRNYTFIPLKYDINGEKSFKVNQIKQLLNNIYNINTFFEKRNKFQNFISNNFDLTDPVQECKDIEKLDFDYIICGSDQIWNPEIGNGLDKVYFAQLNDKNRIVRISYAASVGKEQINIKYIPILKKYLDAFDFISVRERSSVKTLKCISNKDIKCVLDPTLMVDSTLWNRFINPHLTKEKYLLIYRMENNPKIDVLAEQVARALGLEIIEIGAKNLKYKVRHKLLSNLGIEEFLSYFYNAEFVITNSFHGTVFSIIFKKCFYALLHSTLGLRIKDLLEDLSLSNRIVDLHNNVDINNLYSIDWKKTYLLLDGLRGYSVNFLYTALGFGGNVND